MSPTTVASNIPKPAWQTADLDEEWIDDPLHDGRDNDDTASPLTRSFVVHDSPVPDDVELLGHTHIPQSSSPERGTFQIREDQPAAPIGHLLEKKNQNRNAFKDFFTPLALETMFNPPSPHQSHPKTCPSTILESSHSATSTACAEEENMEFTGNMSNDSIVMDDEEQRDVILASDIPNLVAFDGRKPSNDYQFTFSAVQSGSAQVNTPPPISQATAPATDPRLRLFQFQYDTFTREHLSAVVDSIAVHASDSSKSVSPQIPSSTPQCQEPSCSDLRAPKRLKLTPPGDVSVNQPFGNPKSRKDYVGESRSLMQKIKDARSPSMMTILAELRNSPHRLDNTNCEWKEKEDHIEPYSFWSTDSFSATTPSGTKSSSNSAMPSSCLQPSTVQNTFSSHAIHPASCITPSMPLSLSASAFDTHPRSSNYRQQAVDLMAQIRRDVTKEKRVFSSGTRDEASLASKTIDAGSVVQVSITPASPDSTILVQQSSTSRDLAPLSEKQHKPIKPSPRKLLRRLSAADEVDREIAMNKSASETSLVVELSAQPSSTDDRISHFTPSSFTDSIRLHASDQHQVAESRDATASNSKFLIPPSNDMIPDEPIRKVSSGTTTSVETADSVLTRATTATSSTSLFTARSVSAGSADSAASFVKHPGPAQITRITPDDLPLPEIIGGMRFDRTLMRWVKAHAQKAVIDEGALTIVSEESDDPFRDIESIHSGKLDETVEPLQKVEESDVDTDDYQGNDVSVAATIVKILSIDSDTDDSFDFDYRPEAVVEIMTGEESHDTAFEATDYEAEDLHSNSGQHNLEVEEEDTILASSHRCSEMESSAVVVANLSQFNTPTPAHRSNIPPRSVLKNGTGSYKSTPQVVTPHMSFLPGHRRSVSFSDGKKDGKIQGLGWYEPEDDDAPSPHPMFPTEGSASITPSVRGKRIAAILDDLADLNLNEEHSNTQKVSNTRVLTESRPILESLSSKMKGVEVSMNGQSNRTYLTECSFGVSHDKLVQIITDIHPYVPYWEKLEEIDLTGKGVESVARLKELLPYLDKVHLDHNRLSWLTGLPNSVRTLSISSNLLTSLTSFNHLTNLECLDISNNGIESLKQLSSLRHVRELRADGNTITSLEGLEELDGLVKLSLKGNKITHVNFEEVRWPRLELLNISRNELRSITGLSSLSSLSVLNLDHNQLLCLEPERTMPRLHTLRISNNHVTQLDSGRFCNIRILYADNNRLAKVHGLERLRKLESLSLRNQGGQLTLSMRDIRDVKRLYLSGNSLPPSFLQEPCYNLIYLELAGCRLTSLPCNLCRLIPNIRVLNLNYNFLTDTRALDGLTRLRKLTLIGSRLKGTKSLVRILRRMPDVEMLDFRMNPCTLGWYLPILVQDIPGILQPSEDQPYSGDDTSDGPRSGSQRRNSSHKKHGNVAAPLLGRSPAQSWQELDAKFRGDLPDEAYVGRLAYRGLVMRACPKIKMLDGVLISAGEREKAERLLRDVLAAKRKPGV